MNGVVEKGGRSGIKLINSREKGIVGVRGINDDATLGMTQGQQQLDLSLGNGNFVIQEMTQGWLFLLRKDGGAQQIRHRRSLILLRTTITNCGRMESKSCRTSMLAAAAARLPLAVTVEGLLALSGHCASSTIYSLLVGVSFFFLLVFVFGQWQDCERKKLDVGSGH